VRSARRRIVRGAGMASGAVAVRRAIRLGRARSRLLRAEAATRRARRLTTIRRRFTSRRRMSFAGLRRRTLRPEAAVRLRLAVDRPDLFFAAGGTFSDPLF
jgi:hypothetical protein